MTIFAMLMVAGQSLLCNAQNAIFLFRSLPCNICYAASFGMLPLMYATVARGAAGATLMLQLVGIPLLCLSLLGQPVPKIFKASATQSTIGPSMEIRRPSRTIERDCKFSPTLTGICSEMLSRVNAKQFEYSESNHMQN